MSEAELAAKEGATLSAAARRTAILASQAASSLHMLLRNMRMYDADNAVFVEPLETLRSVINEVVARDGKFHLQVVGTLLGLNGVNVHVDFAALEMLRVLTEQLKSRGLGGLEVDKPLEAHELKRFLHSLASIDEGGDASALSGFVGVRPARWAEMRAAVDASADRELGAARRIDREKYALTVASRAITWLKRLLSAIENNETPPPLAPLNGVLRDLVDLAQSRPRQLLRLSRARGIDDALLYHGVNTCLLSAVLGSELGIGRDALQDLARAALLHEVGMRGTDRELLLKPGSALDEKERAKLAGAPIVAARALLRLRPLDVALLRSMVIVSEVKDTVDVDAAAQPSPLARIVRVASTYDALTSEVLSRQAYDKDVALSLLRTQLRRWFDQGVVETLARLLAEPCTSAPAATRDP